MRQEAIERFLQFPSYYETRLVPGSYAEYRYHQYFNKKFEKSYFKLAEERRKIAINHSKNWVPDLLAKLISIPTSTDQSISCYDPSDNSCSVKYSMVPHYLEKNGHSTSSQNQEISIISNEITPSEDQETKDHSLSAGPFLVMEEKSRYVELCAEEQIRTYLIPARNIESSNLCQDISEQFFIDKDKNEISITEIEDDVNNEQQTGSVLSGDLRTSSFSDSLSTDNNFTDCDTSQQNSEYYSCRSEDKSDLSHSQDNSSYESFYHEKVLCSSFENYDSLKSQSDLNLQSEFEKEIDAFEIPLNKENIIVPNKSFNRVFEFEAALYSKDCEQSLQLLENNYKSNLNRSMNNLKCCNFDKIKAPPNNTNFECSLEELKNVEELKNRSNEYFYRKKDQNDPNKSNFSNLTNNDSVNIFKNHININDSFVIQIEESLDCKPHLKTKETHCVPKTHHESLNDIQKHSEFLQIPTLKPISNLAKCSLLDTNLPYSHLVEWHEYFKEYFLPYIRTQQIKNIIKNDRESISRSKPCKIQATDPFVERFKKPINQLPFDFEMNNTDENNIEDIFLSTNQPMVDETYLSQEIINGAKNCYMTLSQGERRYLNLTTFEELGEPLNTYKLFPMMKKKQELKKQIDNLNASLEARQTYSSIVKRFAENIGNQENGFNCKTPSWISNREEMLNIFPSILKDNNHNINNLNQLGPCYSEVVKSGKKEKTKEFVGEPIFYNLKTIGPLCSSGKIDQICSKTQKIDANRKLELQKLYDMNLIQDSRRLQHYQALIRHKSDLEDRILGSSASNQFSATPTTLVDPKFFLHNIKSNSDSAKCLEVRYKEKVYMIHPSSNPEEYLALYFCWDEYWENDHFFLSRKPYTFMFQNNNNGIGKKPLYNY